MTSDVEIAPLPVVTVIIPCFNASDKLRTVLDALALQTYPRDSFEVLVVDDGSTDATAEIAASYPFVKVVRQSNGGSYKARNTGIRASRSEIIAFTDDDCRPAPGWLFEGVRALIDAKADLAGGKVELEFTNPRSIVELYDANFHLKQEFYVERMRWAVTANLFVRRSVVEAIDGFNETTRSGADRVFGQSATSAGFRLVYADRAIVAHPTRPTLKALLQKNRRITYGKALVAYNPRHFIPRGIFKFPENFHTPEVMGLRGKRFVHFYVLYYLIEFSRVYWFVRAVISIAYTGQRKVPFRGLRQGQDPVSGTVG